MKLIENIQTHADHIEIITNYYELMRVIVPDETYAILDNDYEVINSGEYFNSVFNDGKLAIGIKFQELHNVKYQSQKLLNKLSLRLMQRQKFCVVLFTNVDSVVKPLFISFNTIASGWYVKVQRYSDFNVLCQVIQSASKKISPEVKRQVLSKLNKLNDYQLTICYLVAHNFSNQRIADIINELTPNSKPKTRSAISMKIERIRMTLEINSKKFLTECLLAADIIQDYPHLLFANKMFIF